MNGREDGAEGVGDKENKLNVRKNPVVVPAALHAGFVTDLRCKS